MNEQQQAVKQLFFTGLDFTHHKLGNDLEDYIAINRNEMVKKSKVFNDREFDEVISEWGNTRGVQVESKEEMEARFSVIEEKVNNLKK